MVYDDFDEIVLSMLEKNFSLTRLQKLLEENGFLSFFANLSKQNKKDFLYLIKLIKKNPNDSRKNFINAFLSLENELSKKVETNTITSDELLFLIFLTANKILTNEEVNKDLVKLISENYILKKPFLIAEELLILLMYNIELASKFTNQNCDIRFTSSISAFAQMSSDMKQDSVLQIDGSFYNKMLELEKISESDYFEMFCYQTFAILHEFRHAQQFSYVVNNDDDYSRILQKEIAITQYYCDFYLKYHEFFLLEKEANEFAFENLEKFCHGFLTPDYIKKFILLAKAKLAPKHNSLKLPDFKEKFAILSEEIEKQENVFENNDKKTSF